MATTVLPAKVKALLDGFATVMAAACVAFVVVVLASMSWRFLAAVLAAALALPVAVVLVLTGISVVLDALVKTVFSDPEGEDNTRL